MPPVQCPEPRLDSTTCRGSLNNRSIRRSVLPTPSSPGSVSCSSGSRTISSWRSSRCSGRSTAATSTRRACLKRLPSAGERVLQGPGENAGVIDLGEGEAVAFKVESHNHPSAVEPFQGAATGVGGILRDIVAMGARPVALLDGLRFGEPGWGFRPRGRGDRPLRQLRRRAHGRRRGGLRRGLRRQLPRQRDVRRAAPGRTGHSRAGARHRQPARPLRRHHRPRRDRRRLGAREPGARRRLRGEAALGAGRRPVHRQEADRGLARARRGAGSSSRCRTAAPPGSPPRSPRWRAARPESTSTSTASRCARTGWSRGRS